MPGPKVRCAWSLCSVREETASTKVVLWSRVLVRRESTRDCAAYFSWLRAESFVNELDVVPPLLFGLWSCSSLFGDVFVCGLLVVSDLFMLVGLVAVRGGRRVPPFLSFDSSYCWSRSRWRDLSRFLAGVLFLPLAPVAAWRGLRCVGPPRVRHLSHRRRGACPWRFYRFLRSLEFGPFSRYLRVARCPPGEICGKYFLTFAASSFPSWRLASEFFCSSQLQIQEAAERRGLRRPR